MGPAVCRTWHEQQLWAGTGHPRRLARRSALGRGCVKTPISRIWWEHFPQWPVCGDPRQNEILPQLLWKNVVSGSTMPDRVFTQPRPRVSPYIRGCAHGPGEPQPGRPVRTPLLTGQRAIDVLLALARERPEAVQRLSTEAFASPIHSSTMGNVQRVPLRILSMIISSGSE